ncbi:hypothetical protein ACFX1T_043548 [Malus domestica]
MTTKRHCPRPYYSSKGRAWGSYLRTSANHNVPTQDSVTATQEHEVQCVFGVHDVNEELVVSVCHQDEEQSGLFYGGSELVGRVFFRFRLLLLRIIAPYHRLGMLLKVPGLQRL